MKILHVTPCFYPAEAYGGPVSVAYNVCRELARRGHEVTVYTTDSIDRYSRQKPRTRKIEGVNVYYFRNLSNSLAWQRLFLAPNIIFQMRKEIKTFDVIHLQDFRNFQNPIVHHFAAKCHVPCVMQAHGSVLTFFHRGTLKRIFDAVWGRNIFRDISRFIAITPAEAEQYRKMGINSAKIDIIPNAIDLLEFQALPKRGVFRDKYNLKANCKVILYLGRINKIKGLELLVNTFAAISTDSTEAKLVIVGPDDGYLPDLMSLIKSLRIEDRVLFTGPLYGINKLTAYVDADIYVLPSFYESFSVTVLEAAACRTPVIVSDNCGIADFIHGKAGLAVSRDSKQLGKAIVNILNDDLIRQKFSEQGRALVLREFNLPKAVDLLEKTYEAARIA